MEQRLEEMGLEASPPVLRTNRVAALQHGDLVYLSGRIPTYPDGSSLTGKVGADLTWEQGYEAARQTAVNLLSELKEFIGDLDRVTQVLKLLCMVNTADPFFDRSGVCDGASDLLHELYGESGRHTRSAVGIACPAGNMAIEIEMVVVVE